MPATQDPKNPLRAGYLRKKRAAMPALPLMQGLER
jgi:hypothetical protein